MSEADTRRSRRRKAGGLGAALVLAAAATVLVAAPANAAPGDCALGSTCLWTAPYYIADQPVGNAYTYLGFAHCIDNLTWYSYNDKVSSVYNNGRTDSVYLYPDAYKGGNALVLANGAGYGRLADYGYNDLISSVYFWGNLGSAHTSTCS